MALSPTSSRSSGSGGTALTVTDGVTPVVSVATLDFTAGVTVSDAGGGQANASVTGAAPSFTPVVTKTANYSALAGGYVPADPTGGSFNVTLPSAPANGTLVAVEHVGSANSVTMVAGAGDTIDAGGTATNVNTNRRAFIYCYRASDKVWFGLTSLTTAVLTAAAGGTEIVVGGTSAAPTFRTGTLDVIATNRPPVAAVAFNAQKATGVADPTAAQDAATKNYVDSNSTAGPVIPVTMDGRLTLTSGTAITTADVTAASTIYLTPFRGNKLALYDGSKWSYFALTEISLALSGLTSGANYDVFVYSNAGTPTLELSAVWTNATTRADALTTQDGVLVKSGATTRRYIGTIRTTGTTTTEDSGGGTTTQVGGKRFVWNYYNRVRRFLAVIDTTDSWIYATNTWRQANNAAGNKVEYVMGMQEDAVEAETVGVALLQSNTREAFQALGIDSTTVPSGNVCGGYNSNVAAGTGIISPCGARWNGYPGIGYHAINWIEKGADGTGVFLGDNGGTGEQSGLRATVFA